MSREWKPGDVAVLTVPHKYDGRDIPSTQHICIRDNTGSWASGTAAGRIIEHSWLMAEPRPLVVIDAEDESGDLSRLWRLLPDNLVSVDQLQAALREYANPKPPKPDEPQGLYARVEDAGGRIWVRTALQASVWRRECVNSGGFRYLIPQDGCENYADIAAVRVLSPGVEVDQ